MSVDAATATGSLAAKPATPAGMLWAGRVLSAIFGLLTAVMGGAVATRMRVGDPLFSHVLFGVYLGVLLWGGLWLRDARLRALTPWRV